MDSGPSTPAPPVPGPASRRPPTPVIAGIAGLGVVAVVIVAVVAAGGGWFSGSSAPSSSAVAAASLPPAPQESVGLGFPIATPPVVQSGPPPSHGPIVSVPAGRKLAAKGEIVVLGTDGSLTVVEASGKQHTLDAGGNTSFLFPAWSPDGSRIAGIRYGVDVPEIDVFDPARATTSEPIQPTVIFRSPTITPFYLSWTPDGSSVSFLADEDDSVSLRLASSDGSQPLNGSAPGAKVRSGNPFYFDWIAPGRLFAHIGSGPDALLGELGDGGSLVGPSLGHPGDFRSPVVSRDGASVAFVRAAGTGAAQVVVASRDGRNERTMAVFGTAAVTFAPTGHTVASVGPTVAGQSAYTIPFGPLRILDGDTGKTRTLVDSSVVSYWWAPDGRTIAALRVQPVDATSPAPSAAAAPSVAGASPAPATEIRLLFIDVATGKVRADPVVRPGQLFIDQYLTYFDQYSLSHQLWAPDSSSFLLPVVDPDGVNHVAAMFPNGDPPILIDGSIAFWSP